MEPLSAKTWPAALTKGHVLTGLTSQLWKRHFAYFLIILKKKNYDRFLNEVPITSSSCSIHRATINKCASFSKDCLNKSYAKIYPLSFGLNNDYESRFKKKKERNAFGSLNVISLVKLMISVAKNLNILPISNIHCLSYQVLCGIATYSFYKFNQLKY